MALKCVVWDLDNTIWNGTLAENDDVVPNPEIVTLIRELDRRGVLNSIASRNSYDAAIDKLRQFGILDLFLCPQISWGSKSEAISRISSELGIGINTFAFIDDEPFERSEVETVHPVVKCMSFTNRVEVEKLLDFAQLPVSEEARTRRELYRGEMKRREEEVAFTGTRDEFLATLGLEMDIWPASEADLNRARELVTRTNQLNSTGLQYSREELAGFIDSSTHKLLVARLRDRFGCYGIIGVALLETQGDPWVLRLLLMSCRVLARGVGGVFLDHIVNASMRDRVGLDAAFKVTSSNRIMHITFKLSEFEEKKRDGADVLFSYRGGARVVPSHIRSNVVGL